ncbi:SixA phosphatase family protein [Foetidibacter luteolus]|uniref:SixA phosphatase family protein n=1 Tax=Foetidibacter luteolus TaxID=2608880 RepID=UPI00129B533C|nr:phosphoglycerate mutase family protein [Foetidibacter luteolus]
MRKLILPVITLLLLMLQPAVAKCQNTTIILLRHAEKDTAATDPTLSAAGFARANKLQSALAAYKPDMFYSTNYRRTRQTITPWAAATGKEIMPYDPDALTAFAESLKKIKGKTIVVAGHSNTTPQLANKLLGNDKYQTLDDAVYNQIWIIKLQEGKAADEVITY